jgi:hypothetical protein
VVGVPVEDGYWASERRVHGRQAKSRVSLFSSISCSDGAKGRMQKPAEREHAAKAQSGIAMGADMALRELDIDGGGVVHCSCAWCGCPWREQQPFRTEQNRACGAVTRSMRSRALSVWSAVHLGAQGDDG